MRDSAHVYFRVKFQNMTGPISYQFTDERFAPGVVIAIKRGEKGPRRLQPICHDVEFERGLGYDLKLSAGFGVTLSDSFGKVFYATGDLSDDILKKDEKTLEFSLPVALIGEPESDWLYFVGVGLVSDRTMNFFGGPMPVRDKHPVLISGGNFSHGNPAFIDILLPGETDQEDVLGAYDATRGIRAVVPMFGPGG
ncbi:MAG: glucodextranase DOMON-like domain-containing protein [Candidatus Eisenbacteria bacterium]